MEGVLSEEYLSMSLIECLRLLLFQGKFFEFIYAIVLHMSLIVSFKRGEDVRSFGPMKQSDASFVNLKNTAAKCFKLKPASSIDNYSLQYADDEGDLIRLATDADVVEAFSLYTAAKRKEIVISLENASSADFGFELVDDEFSSKPKTTMVVDKPSPDTFPVISKAAEEKAAPHPLLNTLLAQFVEHVTLPDRIVLQGGDRARKTWRVRNIGACAWPEGCVVSFSSGDDCFKAREFITKSIEPNSTVDVSIDITIPSKQGRYTSFFHLTDPSGKKAFGPHLWIDVVVAAPVEEKAVSKTVEPPKPVVQAPSAHECPQTFGKYNEGMLQLWKMGYKDCGRNLYLLDKFNGDVQSVVLFLIEHQFS